MGVYDTKAAIIKAPFGDGVANTSPRFFDCTPTSQAHAVPASWAGKIVRIANETANMAQFFFSFNSAATCDETIAATAAGTASPSLGGSIFGNTERHVQLPHLPNENQDFIFFVRASAVNTSLRLELVSP
jgi:hypothetical protein